ncbi:MAG: diaminopimelate epimerase [Gammaproteobacteria bacterium]|nr:diaminopimelate epimerase [Gammaproteobacteria bacterium]
MTINNIEILKCHGSENDFILLDESDGRLAILETDRPALAKLLCDRNNGAGADGVLFYQDSDAADCRMRMFNPDGSEAEMCGNGLRCTGRYCAEKNVRETVSVETMKAVLEVKHVQDILPGIATYEAEISPVSMHPATLPMDTEKEHWIDEKIPSFTNSPAFTAVSVPNPHIIGIVEEIDEKTVRACGRQANESRVFPRGVNVSFVKLLKKRRIYALTYERGVGITHSCGTAMSAACFVSAYLGYVPFDEYIDVLNKGGMVKCKALNDPDPKINFQVRLSGNATFVFEAQAQVDLEAMTFVQKGDTKTRMDEIESYKKLKAGTVNAKLA